jgi:HEAT repeat protein
MAEIVPFGTVIKALLDETNPFPARYLNQFSDIDPDHLKALTEAWPRIALTRKQSVLEDLENIAENDTLLSFDDLARNLLKDPDAVVRTLAIRLLWECDDVKLVPIFLKILKNDPSTTTSATAATALGLFIYLGELEEIPPQILKNVQDELLKAARDNKDSLVRRRAIEALGASSRTEVAELIDSAYKNSDPEWTASALFAMGRSCDQHWGKKVIARIRHQNENVRMEAIQAAGNLSLDAARPVLLRHLDEEDEDLEMRQAIIWSLSQIGGEGVNEKLEELLETTTDLEEEDFLEEALENLNLTNEMASFSLLNLDSVDEIDDEADQDD